jgi:SAM-dependent methyltransferase
MKQGLYGTDNFDKKYYAGYYKKYDQKELETAYRWFKGWIRIINWLYPLKKFKDKRVLVIGSGIGAFPKVIKEAGFDIDATDISAFITSKAKILQNDINFRIEKFSKSSTKNDFYDLIFVIKTFERLENPTKEFQNIKNRLKKDGTLIFFSPYPTKANLIDPTHINVKKPEEWVKIGRQLGFKKTRFRYISFLPLLYRYHTFFSMAFPIKTDLPFIVCTCLFFFEN